MANLRVDKITSTETFEKTGSVQFVRVTSSRLTTDLGSGLGDNFTIEFWILASGIASGSNSPGMFQLSDTSGGLKESTESLSLAWSTSNNYSIFYAGSIGTGSITNDPNTNDVWKHYAMVRNNGVLKIYVDGIEKTSVNVTDDFSGYRYLAIGTYYSTSYPWQGHISNFRILNNKALYTANFKPPMRELEVVPGTVLLACQSKTDATLEKTGKTLTVGGDAVASELTPGILTPVPKAGAGSAITGSVEFDGSGSTTGGYLELAKAPFQFLHKGTDSYTVESWVHKQATTQGTIFDTGGTSSTTIGTVLFGDSGGVLKFRTRQALQANPDALITTGNVMANDMWHHVALTYDKSTVRLFVNGILVGSASYSTESSTDSTQSLKIGAYEYSTDTKDGYFNGYISNLRIVKGTALYTDDFIPPTRELKKVPGTVLLCCQDPDNPLTEATGKTITGYGDPAASNFTPQVGDDRKVTFEGVTKINSDAYFYLPTGDTASREATGTYNAGTRGVMMGGIVAGGSGKNATIDYWTMASTGDAIDFGDCTAASGMGAGFASRVRGVNAGGFTRDSANFDYVTIMSTGNALDFGDLPVTHSVSSDGGFSSETRGVFHQGLSTGPTTFHNIINYVTISSTGNAQDFGDTTTTRLHSPGVSSPTRGVWAGGYNPSTVGEMDYVTIASTGNAKDFGELITPTYRLGGCSSAIRGLFFGGGGAPSLTNTISYITIATTGNIQDFGDLVQAQEFTSGTSSSTRGVKVGGSDPSPGPYSPVGTIEYFEIATTGNAQAFGDLSVARARGGTFSNGHGGLG